MMAGPERLPPGFLPVLLSLGLPLALVLFAYLSAGGHLALAPEEDAVRPFEAAWLTNLERVEGFRLTEYLDSRNRWELQAPLANIRLRRYVFGRLRTRRTLHLVQPRASLPGKAGLATIIAQRAYYDPQEATWTFVNGLLRQGRAHRRFAELAWHPATARLDWRARRERLPVLRYWLPVR